LQDWKPRWGIRSSILNLARIYREHGLQQHDFEGPRYQRVAHLRRLMATGAVDTGLRILTTARSD